MDASTLVTNKIDEGRKLIRQLHADHVDVTAAAWAKRTVEEDWVQYIVTKLADGKGQGEAYGAASAALDRLPGFWIERSDIKPIGVANPIARDILAARNQARANGPIWYPGQQLGGVPIDDAYIYPFLSSPTFDVLAKGKEEVLRYLECEALSRAGSRGEYLIGRDDEGNLVAFLAGHGFIGAGTISLGSERLVVVDGIVTDVHS
jgi:hypothetical protein